MNRTRSVSTATDNEAPINYTILSNPHFKRRACSGYTLAIRSGDAFEYVGQFQTIDLAINVVRARLRLLGRAFGKCSLEHTETGICAIYANNATINIDIEPSECDGHVKTYRGATFAHCGTDSLAEVRVELDSIDVHGDDGSHEETTWHVWFTSEFETGIRPQDIPRLIETLREMHDVWLECSD